MVIIPHEIIQKVHRMSLNYELREKSYCLNQFNRMKAQNNRIKHLNKEETFP